MVRIAQPPGPVGVSPPLRLYEGVDILDPPPAGDPVTLEDVQDLEKDDPARTRRRRRNHLVPPVAPPYRLSFHSLVCREVLFIYYRTGKLEGEQPTAAEVIFLLSQAAKTDLFPYFRRIGTRVRPVPLDFKEPGRLKKAVPEPEERKDTDVEKPE